MCYGALQRQVCTCCVQGFGKSGAVLGRLEPKMIIPMTDLGFASWFDDVHLTGDSIRRAQVCFANDFEERVAEVLYETRRVLEAVFGEGVPDPGVGACGGEVVTFCTVLLEFTLDDGLVSRVGGVDGGLIRVEVLEDEDAWSVDEDVVDFILESFFLRLVDISAVINWNILLNVAGQWVCLFECGLFDQSLECRERGLVGR